MQNNFGWMVFRADTGNSRKIVIFTCNCLYGRRIKVVSVDNIIRNNQFYYFTKFMYSKFLFTISLKLFQSKQLN